MAIIKINQRFLFTAIPIEMMISIVPILRQASMAIFFVYLIYLNLDAPSSAPHVFYLIVIELVTKVMLVMAKKTFIFTLKQDNEYKQIIWIYFYT